MADRSQGGQKGRRNQADQAKGRVAPARGVEGDETDGGLWSDPTVERAFVEDPLFKFLREWSKPLIISVVSVALIFWVFSELQKSREAASRRAALVYDKLRGEYDTYRSAVQNAAAAEKAALVATPSAESTAAPTTPAPEGTGKPEEARKPGEAERAQVEDRYAKVQEVVHSLADHGGPYKKIADTYRDLSLWSKGEALAAPPDASKLPPSTDQSARFLEEVRALVLARAALERADTAELGKKSLTELAEKGEFVAVVAALSIARIAQTDEERVAAVQTLQALSARSPEQAPLLSDEIKRLS